MCGANARRQRRRRNGRSGKRLRVTALRGGIFRGRGDTCVRRPAVARERYDAPHWTGSELRPAVRSHA